MSAAALDDVVAAALRKEKRIADLLGVAKPSRVVSTAPASSLTSKQKRSSSTPLETSSAPAKASSATPKKATAQSETASALPKASSSATSKKATSQSKAKAASNIVDDDAKRKGTSKKRKKRSRPAVDAGSNWKKLKATLDAENADNGGGRDKSWLRKKREREKRKQNAEDAPPNDDDKKDADGGDVGHSQFARRQVATRDGALTKVIALDCEMVEIAGGQDALARVSLVNVRGDVVYDEFVSVKQRVVDYRTAHSGVTAEHLSRGRELSSVRSAVAAMLRGRILVGHALRNDMRALAMSHPKHMTRDTALYFRRGRNRPKLAFLVAAKLGVDNFQKGSHDSAEDARAALALYKKFASEWEASLRGEAKRKDDARTNETQDER